MVYIYWFTYSFFFKHVIFLLKKKIFVWLCWVSVVACGIFSCYLASLGLIASMQDLQLWHTNPLVAVYGDLVPWPRIKPKPSALGGKSVSHRTTKEIPVISY